MEVTKSPSDTECWLMMTTTHNLTDLNLNHGNEQKNLNVLEMGIGSK
jgi:hypothetical protein